tara:strand:+ start:154 stop:699 length:546 start_codon:yes stop_codon:yes gene_type:complete
MTTQEPGNTQGNDGEIGCAGGKPLLSFGIRKFFIHVMMLSFISGAIAISNVENIMNINSYRSFFAHLFIWLIIIFLSWTYWKVIKSMNETRDLYRSGLVTEGVIISSNIIRTSQFGPEPISIKYKYSVGGKTYVSKHGCIEGDPEKHNFNLEDGAEVSVLYTKEDPRISVIYIANLDKYYE